MFDLRYHAASLAAVFLALALGVLLGVAISGKVSNTQESAQKAIIDRLTKDLAAEGERTAAARSRGEAAERVVEDAYPSLMEGRLPGKRFAVLFLGGVDGGLRSAIERTLADGGSGAPMRMTALALPLDPKGLQDLLAPQSTLAAYASGKDWSDLGRDLGRELVLGGVAPLWGAVAGQLVEERSGTSFPRVDGVIVVRSWSPAPSGVAEVVARRRATEPFIDGVLDGLQATGVPVVGVEKLGTEPADSAIDLYRKHGVSSVDDADTVAGRLALGLLLAGAEPGHYGVKDSASDGVTPPIEPVPAATVGG